MPDELKPKLDDFTAKVVSDPAKPQETLLLQGFLGASSQPDHTRVYSDLTLDSCVERRERRYTFMLNHCPKINPH